MYGVKEMVFGDEAYIIGLRRFFHENPEISMREFETSKKIQAELKSMGIPYEMVGECGIIGILQGKTPGKTIALRADIDALPMDENECNNKMKKTCVAKVKGAAHTCGHDAHTAMLLGAAKTLSALRDQITGTVLFCFEQAEETGGGIGPLMDALSKKKVDAAWGIHLSSELGAGLMAMNAGPRQAGAVGFDIIVKGKGAHGSRPDLGIDPILCAIKVVDNLHMILTREISPFQPLSFTVGKFQSGTAGNIIPETARFSGSSRYFDSATGDKVMEAIPRIVKGTCEAHRCEYEIVSLHKGNPVVNDEGMSAIAKAATQKVLGKEWVSEKGARMGSESFNCFTERYPATFAHLGIVDEENGVTAPNHNPRFDIVESALKHGAAATVQVALDFLAL